MVNEQKKKHSEYNVVHETYNAIRSRHPVGLAVTTINLSRLWDHPWVCVQKNLVKLDKLLISMANI